ncbi:MAG: hypothetical protein IPJ65_04795 [Archangiaceae bacterium]|nr:hypothetical protein [Archangiaceae bacterium]
MPLLRGLALVNDLVVLRQLYGDGLVRRFAERLTPAQRRDFDEGFLPGRWYDEDIQARLCLCLRDELDDFGVFRVGVAIGHHHATRVQRFLARIAGPRRLLQRATGLWHYWRDGGRTAVERYQEGSAVVAVYDHPLFATPGYATLYGGACAFLVSIAGGRDVRLRAEVVSPAHVFAEVRWLPDRRQEPGFHSVDQALRSLPPP